MQIIEPANRKLKFLLVGLSVVVLAITLGAGLWPFSFHAENQVWWKPQQAGLYFDDHGMLISKDPFRGLSTNTAVGCSVELWLEPALTSDSSTLLSFYEPGAASRFEVRQSQDDLAIVNSARGGAGQRTEQKAFQDHVFEKGQPVLITLTYEEGRLAIYLNGVWKRTAGNVAMRSEDFRGTMIVANTPYAKLSWSGTFRGLAIYDRTLKPDEIRQDFLIWQSKRELIAQKAVPPYSLYLFNEKNGKVLHDAGKTGHDLLIPEHYFLFEGSYLTPFWREYRPGWEYKKDLAINVFGLVPLGLCVAAAFAWLRGQRNCLLYVTMFGFCVSLTIEVLQAFMPTRVSGTTDLITNTIGAALGGWIYLNGYTQGFLRRFGLLRAA